jgi:hypothetical protein
MDEGHSPRGVTIDVSRSGLLRVIDGAACLITVFAGGAWIIGFIQGDAWQRFTAIDVILFIASAIWVFFNWDAIRYS